MYEDISLDPVWVHLMHTVTLQWPWQALYKTILVCFPNRPISFFVLAELTHSQVRENKRFSISSQESNGECDSPLAYTTHTFIVLKALLSSPFSFCHFSRSIFLSPFSSPSCKVSRVDWISSSIWLLFWSPYQQDMSHHTLQKYGHNH